MANTMVSNTLQKSAAAESHTAKAFAAQSPTSPVAASSIPRRNPQPNDVEIEILFCGVCHSDLHQARNEWVDFMPTVYPCVPRPRDCRPRDQGRQRGKEGEGGDTVAGGLHARLLWKVCQLQGRHGATLR